LYDKCYAPIIHDFNLDLFLLKSGKHIYIYIYILNVVHGNVINDNLVALMETCSLEILPYLQKAFVVFTISVKFHLTFFIRCRIWIHCYL